MNWMLAIQRLTHSERSYLEKSKEAILYGNFSSKPKKMLDCTRLLSDIRELVLKHRNDRKNYC